MNKSAKAMIFYIPTYLTTNHCAAMISCPSDKLSLPGAAYFSDSILY